MSDSLHFVVKHGSTEHKVEVPASANVLAICEHLEPVTRVLARKQKLIFKGKVLDQSSDLATCKLVNGSKLLLLASEGTQTKGQQASAAQERARTSTAASCSSNLSTKYQEMKNKSTGQATARPSDLASRRTTWQATGIAALRDLGLTGPLPDSLLQGLGPTVKAADLSCNQLTELPACLGELVGLTSLKLASNELPDAGVPWPALACLTALTLLTLDNNQLTALPDEVGALSRLRQLTVSSNRLASLGGGVGALKELELLCCDANSLQALPQEIGGCVALKELNVCGNMLTQLPESLSALKQLQVVRCDNNRVKAVAGVILEECRSLALLTLNNNPITAAQLRDTPGWEQFEARRQARVGKQLEHHVMAQGGGAGFQEGADVQEWQRYASLNNNKKGS